MRDALMFIGSGVLAIFLIVSAIAFTINRVTLSSNIAVIEQLRKDVKKVDSKNAEDVYGLAAKKNLDIVSNQTYNRNWFFDLYIPDDWDEIEVIEIPEGGK